MFAKEDVYDFNRKARRERKAGASFEAGFMRRKWLSHLRLSASICGSVFPKKFIDTEISTPIHNFCMMMGAYPDVLTV